MSSNLVAILAKAKSSAAYHWMKIRLIAILLLLTLTACQSNSETSNRIAVKIERAVSGNTVEMVALGGMERLRLVGIDAPSMSNKPWGPAARDRLNEIIQAADRNFTLELDHKSSATTDNYKYGYLWQGDTLINAQLIREGQGTAVTKYAKYEQQLVRAQYYARMMAVGIWSHVSPMRDNSRPKAD
jgi:micrococcal nuclease